MSNARQTEWRRMDEEKHGRYRQTRSELSNLVVIDSTEPTRVTIIALPAPSLLPRPGWEHTLGS